MTLSTSRLGSLFASALRTPISKWPQRCRQNLTSWRRRRLCKIQRALRARPEAASGILLILPSGIAGSTGDDAILRGIAAALGRQNIPHDFVPISPGEGYEHLKTCRERVPQFANFYDPTEAEWDRFIGNLHRWQGVWAVGADVIDGAYSVRQVQTTCRMLNLAAEAGLDSRILGFSYREHPSHYCRDALAGLHPAVTLIARDPRSLKHLVRDTARGILGADPAFLLEPDTSTWRNTELSRCLVALHNQGRRLLGVNLAAAPFVESTVMSPAEAVEATAKALHGLLDRHPDTCLVLIPHDNRQTVGNVADHQLAASLHDRLRIAHGDRVYFFDDYGDCAMVKALCGDLDAVVTCRMHLAIAALGMGVPPLCIPYQDKFGGLMTMFDHQDALLPVGVLAAGEAQDQIERFWQTAPQRKIKIEQALPSVFEAAQLNFTPTSGAS